MTVEGLGEFEKVMQTRDEVEGLHNCREFSQPHSSLFQAMQTRKTFSIALGGHGENKKLKKRQQNSMKNISFTDAVRKWQQMLLWLLDFNWMLTSFYYLIVTFQRFISASSNTF